jgi:transcriptional regulator with XRE-family HTH domain
MVDTSRLRGIIAERGLSQRKMAKILGMNEKTFYSKMRSGVFGTDEAQIIADVLDIQNPSDIFFARKVT